MELNITHQELYSRGDLLLRTLFGWLYIAVPHAFLLFFMATWSGILGFITFWIVLFTGKFPRSFFDFQAKLMSWNMRLNASLHNLVDGYPAFGVNGTSDTVSLSIEYPEKLSRGLVIVRLLFGIFYLLIPHGFCLFFRFIGTGVLAFLAWWVVLFTGSYPATWHAFNVGSLRWIARLSFYNQLMTDTYPPFSGRP